MKNRLWIIGLLEDNIEVFGMTKSLSNALAIKKELLKTKKYSEVFISGELSL
jgi:hypothetical protein